MEGGRQQEAVGAAHLILAAGVGAEREARPLLARPVVPCRCTHTAVCHNSPAMHSTGECVPCWAGSQPEGKTICPSIGSCCQRTEIKRGRASLITPPHFNIPLTLTDLGGELSFSQDTPHPGQMCEVRPWHEG